MAVWTLWSTCEVENLSQNFRIKQQSCACFGDVILIHLKIENIFGKYYKKKFLSLLCFNFIILLPCSKRYDWYSKEDEAMRCYPYLLNRQFWSHHLHLVMYVLQDKIVRLMGQSRQYFPSWYRSWHLVSQPTLEVLAISTNDSEPSLERGKISLSQRETMNPTLAVYL